uniref:Ankyrin repeat protein n=1 Tax=Apteryx owenii TaxID=8824 RepID=A0A8B9QBN4_APTOW
MIKLLDIAGNHKRGQDVGKRGMHSLHSEKGLKFNRKLHAISWQTTTSGYTPLHLSAREGHEDVASVLLDHGASLAIITKGIAPVHLASQDGHVDMVSLLLTRNANVNLSNKVSIPSGARAINKNGDKKDRGLQKLNKCFCLICQPLQLAVLSPK